MPRKARIEFAGAAYGYTQRNQLSAVNGFASFGYDPSGNMLNRTASWIYSSGTNYSYDEVNRATQIEHGNGQVVFARSHYQYDQASREVATWRDEQSSKGERFTYNPMNQVTNVKYNADQVSTGNPTNATSNVDYIVDALNRTGVIYDGVYWGFQADAMNQYFGVAGTGISYDAQFNQTTGLSGATFSYDAENHLVGGSMQATYDGLGRCVRRTVGGVTRLFTYDDWKPFLEWDGAGNWLAWNIYGAGPDEILARYDASGQVSIYKQDQHGNVVAVLDQFGQVSEKYTYDAFGKPKVFDKDGNERTAGSAIGNRFMFTGREWIKELGIYDYRHRYYDPLLGRFLQSDPMGLQTEGAKLTPEQKALYGAGAPEAFASSEMNLYRYCCDDPVDGSDPMGLDNTPFGMAVESAVETLNITALQVARIHLSIVKAGVPATIDAQPYRGDTSGSKFAVEAGFRATRDYHDPNAGEAVRHEVWMAELARKHSMAAAAAIGQIHELGEHNSPDSRRDKYNNRLGLHNSAVSRSREESEALARKDWELARSARDPRYDSRIPGNK